MAILEVLTHFKRVGWTITTESSKMLEGVLILQNSSLKLKTVVADAILQNYAVSSENISECKK